MPTYSLREWGAIARGAQSEELSLDRLNLADPDWSYLCNLAASTGENDRYLKFRSPTEIKVTNFVGVITTPHGVALEILPKHCDAAPASVVESRSLLLRMLRVAYDLPFLETTDATLTVHQLPLVKH